MGNAAPLAESSPAALAAIFEKHHLHEIAEVVRAKKITPAELQRNIDSRKSVIAFFATQNCDMTSETAGEILSIVAHKQHPAEPSQRENTPTTASPAHDDDEEDDHAQQHPLDPAALAKKLEKLDEEMNSVSTYNDSQEVLIKWCNEAMASSTVPKGEGLKLACAYIAKNSVLMPYMQDDVAINVALKCLGENNPHAAHSLLDLVKDDTKATTVLTENVKVAVKAGDKELARKTAEAIRDETARIKVLGQLNAGDLTPQVRKALKKGDFKGGLQLAKEGDLPMRVIDELLEEAVLLATADGDVDRVRKGLECVGEPNTVSVATRALGSCSSTDMFKVLLGYHKDASQEDQIRVLTRVGRAQAKRLQVEVAEFCIEQLRKELDPTHAAKEAEAPEQLCCPITTQLMRNPVKTPAGHTYDRPAISQWVIKFHSDPMTRAPLNSSDLVPDEETKAKVDKWLEGNADFLKSQKIVRDIFSIQWSFGVGWARAGDFEKVAENVEKVQSRGERIRLLASLAEDILSTGDAGENIDLVKKIAGLAGSPVDSVVVILDIATTSIKKFDWRFRDWEKKLPSINELREVQTVALRFYFTAYSATEDQSSRAKIVSQGNAVAYHMPTTGLQQLRMQLETEYGMSNDHVLFPFRNDEAPIMASVFIKPGK